MKRLWLLWLIASGCTLLGIRKHGQLPGSPVPNAHFRQLAFADREVQPPYDFSERISINPLPINTEHIELLVGYHQHGLLYVSTPEATKRTTWENYKLAPFAFYWLPFQGLEDVSLRKEIGIFQRELVDFQATYAHDSLRLVYFTLYGFGFSTHNIKRQHIFAATPKNEVDWIQVAKVPLDSNSYSVTQPYLSPDGQSLFFVSDMPGSMGGTDIYVVQKTEDGWSAPKNLGRPINSAAHEMFPVMHEDGTLYFASDRHGGLGGLDLYEAPNAHQPGRQSIANLGSPINSYADDLMLLLAPDKREGFMVSNRVGGAGMDDIYQITISEIADNQLLTDHIRPLAAQEQIRMDGQVINAKTKQPVDGALVKLYDPYIGYSQTTMADRQGQFSFLLNPDKNYRLAASAIGYQTDPGQTISTQHLAANYLNSEVALQPRERQLLLSGQVVSQQSEKPISGTRISIFDKRLQEEISLLNSDSAGYFQYQFSNDHDYEIRLRAPGYQDKSLRLSGKNMYHSDEIHYLIPLKPES